MAAAIPLPPLLALLLGVPPKRNGAALGLAVGIILIVGFIQISVAIEDQALPTCNAQQAALLLAFAATTGWLKHYQTQHGPGAIEAGLDRQAQSIRKTVLPFWPRFRRLA